MDIPVFHLQTSLYSTRSFCLLNKDFKVTEEHSPTL